MMCGPFARAGNLPTNIRHIFSSRLTPAKSPGNPCYESAKRRRPLRLLRGARSSGAMQSPESRTLLVANRGEIAIRVMEAAAALGMRTLAIFSEDDANSLHVARADEARRLTGTGPAAYLDAEQIVALAKDAGCNAIHPGYGFLSENAAFARRCGEAGIIFAGPSPELLELFGDKVQARKLAQRCGVPVLPGTPGPTSLNDARVFFSADAKPVVIKAVAGGGGRGMRVVRSLKELDGAYTRCQSEARAAFGNAP